METSANVRIECLNRWTGDTGRAHSDYRVSPGEFLAHPGEYKVLLKRED
jgi:hypothetical protein